MQPPMKDLYTLADLEAAINYWRRRSPSTGDELALCPQAAALAEPYALMIFHAKADIDARQLPAPARAALDVWHETVHPAAGAA